MESILRHLDFNRPQVVRLFSRLGSGRAYTFNELMQFSKLSKPEVIQINNDLVAEGYLKTRTSRKKEYYYMADGYIFHQRFKVTEENRKAPEGMKYSRHCYRHLAGWVGVKLEEALRAKGYVIPDKNGYKVTNSGWKWLESIGIEKDSLNESSTQFSKQCLDFSERKSHIGGHLGDAILKALSDKEWIVSVPDSREMRLTEGGKSALLKSLGPEFYLL